MPRRVERVLCAWCERPFQTRSKAKTCRRSCTGHYIALKRSEASYRAAGRKGGTRSGQARRRAVVENFLGIMTGPMRQFGASLYLVGFMHGQNTCALKYQRELRRLRKAVR